MIRIYIFVILSLVFQISCRNFTRCEVSKELIKQGFPQEQLSDWVCLVEAESSGRTDVIGGPDEDGSFDYGLFQINDRYWCSNSSRPGKECNVRCKDLLSDNITTASKCTKKIYSQQGFAAWVGWANECKGKTLPDLSACDDKIDNETPI